MKICPVRLQYHAVTVMRYRALILDADHFIKDILTILFCINLLVHVRPYGTTGCSFQFPPSRVKNVLRSGLMPNCTQSTFNGSMTMIA